MYTELPINTILLNMIYYILVFIAIVLLSAHRRRAIICAVFAFTVKNLMEVPILFFIGAIARPSVSLEDFLVEDVLPIFGAFYVVLFIESIFVSGCCFLATHWLRKTKVYPPNSLVILFSLFFFIITISVFISARYIMTLMSVSILLSAIPNVLLVAMVPAVFYIFTRLITEKKNIVFAENEIPYTRYIHQLSRRELEVIEAILAGYNSQKELAEQLNISINTIKTHLKHIYQTTGVSGVDALSLLFKDYAPFHPKITLKSP
jgi:DNA-binding CsgD family transcriptional regulator